jgi:hypothetical protein
MSLCEFVCFQFALEMLFPVAAIGSFFLCFCREGNPGSTTCQCSSCAAMPRKKAGAPPKAQWVPKQPRAEDTRWTHLAGARLEQAREKFSPNIRPSNEAVAAALEKAAASNRDRAGLGPGEYSTAEVRHAQLSMQRSMSQMNTGFEPQRFITMVLGRPVVAFQEINKPNK